MFTGVFFGLTLIKFHKLMSETIFVQIVSYRDPQLVATGMVWEPIARSNSTKILVALTLKTKPLANGQKKAIQNQNPTIIKFHLMLARQIGHLPIT